jgi:aminoglycoside phosphotransferase (APT) family kinase protein
MPDIYAEHWQEARKRALAKGLEIVEIGWEQHVIIDKDEGIVWRYPRHAAAAAKLADEVSVLHSVHRQAWPIELPVMRQHDEICTTYDYIVGEVLTAERVNTLNQSDFERIGKPLGEFLALFHRLDPGIVASKKTRQPGSLLEYYTDRINAGKDTEFYVPAKQALDKLNAIKTDTTDVVVHGDLHGPNIVVNPADNSLHGVIDLSEMETGDPHLEFRKIFMTVPEMLDPVLARYTASGGQELNRDKIILWAYVNEWANAAHFAGTPENGTYCRAIAHLKEWSQL